MSDPDVQHARAALAKLEHLVVQDMFLTETANFADVILPASAWPEKNGTVTNTNRQVQMGRKAVPLPGEARQDWWIIQEIARRIGLGLELRPPARGLRRDEARRCRPSTTSPGTGWHAESSVTYPCDAAGPAGPRRGVRRRLPDRRGRAGSRRPRCCRRTSCPTRLPDDPDHRPAARALAYRRDDPPRDRARRAGAGGDRLAPSARPAPAGRRARASRSA